MLTIMQALLCRSLTIKKEVILLPGKGLMSSLVTCRSCLEGTGPATISFQASLGINGRPLVTEVVGSNLGACVKDMFWVSKNRPCDIVEISGSN